MEASEDHWLVPKNTLYETVMKDHQLVVETEETSSGPIICGGKGFNLREAQFFSKCQSIFIKSKELTCKIKPLGSSFLLINNPNILSFIVCVGCVSISFFPCCSDKICLQKQLKREKAQPIMVRKSNQIGSITAVTV